MGLPIPLIKKECIHSLVEELIGMPCQMLDGRVNAFKVEEALACIHMKCEILYKNIADI